MSDNLPKLPPNIDDYLESVDDNIEIDIKENKELIAKVVANTGISYEFARIIVKAFFQEIRNQMLQGSNIIIKSFGKFLICSPLNGSKKNIFVQFKPFKNYIRKLNE